MSAHATPVLLLVFVSLFGKGLAQNGPAEFGNVSVDEVRATNCTFDPTAQAVILFDVVNVELGRGFKYERHIRVKFFGSNPPTEWANVTILYNKRQKRLSKIKAATYIFRDGKVELTTLDPGNILTTKVTKNISKVSFPLPKVTPGSVIEYSYSFISTDNVVFTDFISSIFGSSFDLSWDVQHDIPSYWAEYNIRGQFHSYAIQGGLEVTSDIGEKNARLISKNVPAFHEEMNAPPRSSLIGKVFINLSQRTWNNVNFGTRLLLNYGNTPSDSSLLRQLADKFKFMPNGKTKLDSVVAYVKRQMKWNADVDQFPEREFGAAFISRNGSSAEINLVIMALLSRSGTTCYPVLISTREHGSIDVNRPDRSQFDDLIAGAVLPAKDGKEVIILLDGTDRYLSHDHIPTRCMNELGYMLRSQYSQMIPVVGQRSKTAVNTNLRLDEVKSDVQGEVELIFSGVHASQERDAYFSKGKVEYDQLANQNYPSKISEVSVTNATDVRQPFKTTFKVRDESLVEFQGDHVYVKPFAISPTAILQVKAESRIYPIDINPPTEQVYTAKIELPPNYIIDEVPKSVAFALPNNAAQFYYNVALHGNSVHLTFRLILNRVVFHPGEYAALREFQNQILSKQAETIVLRKK